LEASLEVVMKSGGYDGKIQHDQEETGQRRDARFEFTFRLKVVMRTIAETWL